jgi:CBS domain-containing protein
VERLRYALEFLSLARIRHQALDIQEGREPNNYIEPENVSAAERHGLKDAFQVLSHAQKFLRFRYPLTAPGRP